MGTLPHLTVFGLDTLEFDEGLPASEVGHRNHFRWELRGSSNRLIATMIVLDVHRFPLGSWLWWEKICLITMGEILPGPSS